MFFQLLKNKDTYKNLIISMLSILSLKLAIKITKYFYPDTNDEMINFHRVTLLNIKKCFNISFIIVLAILLIIWFGLMSKNILNTSPNHNLKFFGFLILSTNIMSQFMINFYPLTKDNDKVNFKLMNILFYLIGTIFLFISIFMESS